MWPFKKKPRTPPHVGPTSVTWQAGDIAACVVGRWLCPHNDEPTPGGHYIVAGVAYGLSVDGSATGFGLLLCGFGDVGYDVRGFRKVVPTFEEQKREDRAPAPTRVPA